MIALALATYATTVHVDPGKFPFSIVAGVSFLFAVPLLQWFLLTTDTFKDEHGAACCTALIVVFACLVALAASGWFGY
jgi:hypothetical protein